MILLATFKGYTVLAGVKWTVDKKTLTVTMKQSTRGVGDNKLHTTTWKNHCPYCKKGGILRGGGKKGRKTAVEGEITCTICDNDFCGVTGYKKVVGSKLHLTKASKSSQTAITQESSINDKKKALTEVKKVYKEKNEPKKEFKLTIPPLKGVVEGSYIELKPPLVKTAQSFFIGGIDTAQDDMQLLLYDKVPSPGSEYKEKTSISKNNATSSASKFIEKKIKLKGKELRSISKIYKWLRKDGGNGGWKYKHYKGHKKGENENKFAPNSALWCWNNKTANCVDFAHIFYTMCQGAGIKGVKIIQGKGTFPDGTYDHMWNKTKNNTIIDCSTTKGDCKKYVAKKKVK